MYRLLLLIFFCNAYFLAAKESKTPSIYVAQIDLPQTILDTILSLDQDIKHSWPNANYYRETIDFGKIFPALQEGLLLERPIPKFIAEIRKIVFEQFKDTSIQRTLPRLIIIASSPSISQAMASPLISTVI